MAGPAVLLAARSAWDPVSAARAERLPDALAASANRRPSVGSAGLGS